MAPESISLRLAPRRPGQSGGSLFTRDKDKSLQPLWWMSEQPSLGTVLLFLNLGRMCKRCPTNCFPHFNPVSLLKPTGHLPQSSKSRGKEEKYKSDPCKAVPSLYLGTWNVRARMDRQSSSRPARRTALVAGSFRGTTSTSQRKARHSG